MRNEIIEETKYVPTKSTPASFNKKRLSVKQKNIFILLIFLLIAVTFLMAVSIYCFLIKP